MELLPLRSLLKVPRQARSRQMVRDVLDAAERILRQEGTTALNTNRVASVAGISPGSLYQYFANRDMIVAAILERRALEVAAEVHRMLAGAPASPDAAPRLMLESLLAVLERHTSELAGTLGAPKLTGAGGLATVLGPYATAAIGELAALAGVPVPEERATRFVLASTLLSSVLRWTAPPPAHISRTDLVRALLLAFQGLGLQAAV